MEKIIINGFAGIRHFELEIRPINVIIGPQSSGKSITAKLIYYFKSFFTIIRNGIENDRSKRDIDNEQINKFFNYFPKESWSNDPFSIKYIINNVEISIERTNGNKVKLNWNENLKKLFNRARQIYKKEKINIQGSENYRRIELTKSFNQKFDILIKQELSDNFCFKQIFIPAGRSFFSNIQENIFSFLGTNKSIDPFIIEFGIIYESFKKLLNSDYFSQKDRTKGKDLDIIIKNILNGFYLREKDKDFLLHHNDRKVNIANASSGQQEIFPLIIIIQVLIIAHGISKDTIVYIEEPEAHLSPNAQNLVVKLLAMLFNNLNGDIQMLITTHSPYILSSFNNLLYAGYLSENLDQSASKEITDIIPASQILDPSCIQAISLTENKEIISIIDPETHLIAQNILDDVSNAISIEFGNLMKLEN